MFYFTSNINNYTFKEVFMKNGFWFIAMFIGFALSGCATMTNSLKIIDANTNWIEPSITADLDVSPNKIVGIASGGKKC